MLTCTAYMHGGGKHGRATVLPLQHIPILTLLSESSTGSAYTHVDKLHVLAWLTACAGSCPV
jgi:hypothetical protein